MQTVETLNEGLKRAYTVTITSKDIDARVDKEVKAMAPQVRMPGFRPGKVPANLVKKMHGEALQRDALNNSIQESIQKLIADQKLRPAMQPSVELDESFEFGKDAQVKVELEVLPVIETPSIDGLKLERLTAEVSDAQVEEQAGRIATQQGALEEYAASHKAKDGDTLVIDFVGKVDGEAFEGGSAEDYPLVLGSNSFIPGFEEQLVGVKGGEEKAVTVTFPEEYGAAHLAGKEAVFDCTVKEVKSPKAAEIDDELAKKFGAEDLEALKGQITERLEAEYAGAARSVLKRKLLDALDGVVSFDLPPSLVEAEAKQIAHQLWHEENPDVQGHDHAEIEPTDEHNTLAERRVRLGLLLAELGQKAEVEVSDAEMTQAIMAQARQYPGQERQFFEFVQQNAQMQQQLRAPIFEDKVVDYIFELAQISEKDVTKDELKEAVEALEEEDA